MLWIIAVVFAICVGLLIAWTYELTLRKHELGVKQAWLQEWESGLIQLQVEFDRNVQSSTNSIITQETEADVQPIDRKRTTAIAKAKADHPSARVLPLPRPRPDRLRSVDE